MKGQLYGVCNRTACVTEQPAICYNPSTQAHYCLDCAGLINQHNPGLVQIPKNMREPHQITVVFTYLREPAVLPFPTLAMAAKAWRVLHTNMDALLITSISTVELQPPLTTPACPSTACEQDTMSA